MGDAGSDLKTNLQAYWGLGEESGQRNDSQGTNHLTDNATVTQNNGVSLKDANDGEYIRQVSDLSGNANDAVQTGNVTTKPICKTAVINGKPVKRYDGVNDFVDITDSASLDILTDITIFMVIRIASLASASDIIEKGATGSYTFFLPTNGLIRFIKQGDATSSANSDTALVINTNYIISATKIGSIATIYVNGVQRGQDTTFANFADAGKLKIGKGGDGFFNGDFAEVAIYNRSLNAGELKKLNLYFSRKYGIALI